MFFTMLNLFRPLCLSLCLCLSIGTSNHLAPPQQIMRDRWMNVGHEEEELKPHQEPEPDWNDNKRIGQSHTPNVVIA